VLNGLTLQDLIPCINFLIHN